MKNIENWNDKNFVLQKMKEDSYYFQKASEDLKDDMEVVMKAVTKSGHNIAYASGRLRNNKAVLSRALVSYPMANMYSDRFHIPKLDYPEIHKEVKSIFKHLTDEYLEQCPTEIDYAPCGDSHVACNSYYGEDDIENARQHARDEMIDDPRGLDNWIDPEELGVTYYVEAKQNIIDYIKSL